MANQTRSVEEFKHRIVMLEQELTKSMNLERMVEEYNGKIMLLNEEIERLNSILRGKLQEIDDYKVRYIKIETELKDYRGVEIKIR